MSSLFTPLVFKRGNFRRSELLACGALWLLLRGEPIVALGHVLRYFIGFLFVGSSQIHAIFIKEFHRIVRFHLGIYRLSMLHNGFISSRNLRGGLGRTPRFA